MTSKYKGFQDPHGFIHTNRNPNVNSTENSPLFTARNEIGLALNGKSKLAKRPKWEMLKDSMVKFRDRAVGPCLHFSLDNMTGLYLSRELGHHNMELPVCRWDNEKPGKYKRKYWLHPRDLILFSMLCDRLPPRIIGYLLSPLLFIIAMVSFSAERGNTSGKIKWFDIFATLSLSDTPYKALFGRVGLGIGHMMLKRKHGDKPFLDVAEIYHHQDSEYPLRVELGEWYDNKCK